MSNKEISPRGVRSRVRFPVGRMLYVTSGVAIVAGLLWPIVRSETGHDGANSDSHERSKKVGTPARVEVVRPTRGGVPRLTIQPGSIHAFESVDLYAKASGFLKIQTVDIGSTIKRGQLLAEIDAPELLGDVAEAQAAVEQAKAKAEQAVSRVATTEAEIKAAEASVIQAESDLTRLSSRLLLAQKQYERIKDLNERKAIDGRLVDEQQQVMEAAQSALTTGHAAVATARAMALTAAAKTIEAKADVATANASLRLAEAKLARVKVLADYTRISAPFDGVITMRSFHPGAFIRSAADGSSPPLLTAMRTDLMRVVIQVPDLDVPLLDVGDKVTLEVDALKGKNFTGTIARIGKYEDPTTKTMRVEVDLPNTENLLVEGMYGRGTIVLQPPSNNLTVPSSCVIGHARQGNAAVFVVRNGIAQRTSVKLGGDDGIMVEVLSGLKPDDQVILRHDTTPLDDGSPVRISFTRDDTPVRR